MSQGWISVPVGRGVRAGTSWGDRCERPRSGAAGEGLLAVFLGFLLLLFLFYWLMVVVTAALVILGFYHLAKAEWGVGVFWLVVAGLLAWGEISIANHVSESIAKSEAARNQRRIDCNGSVEGPCEEFRSEWETQHLAEVEKRDAEAQAEGYGSEDTRARGLGQIPLKDLWDPVAFPSETRKLIFEGRGNEVSGWLVTSSPPVVQRVQPPLKPAPSFRPPTLPEPFAAHLRIFQVQPASFSEPSHARRRIKMGHKSFQLRRRQQTEE